MKKFISTLALVTSLTLGANVVKPQEAHAFIWAAHEGDTFGGWSLALFGCVLILPLCWLDEQAESTSSKSVKATDLLANGYSDQEIEQILEDQKTLAEALHARGLGIQVKSFDTKESITREVRSFHPGVSDLYLEVLTSTAGLR